MSNFAFDSNFAESLVAAGEREQGAMAARNREPVLAVAEPEPGKTTSLRLSWARRPKSATQI